MNDTERKLISSAIDTISDEVIKKFAWKLAEDLPQYIWEVGASSTGKYHPRYTLGKLGLMRHMVAVVRFMNYMFELDQYKEKYSSREMDLLRVAGLFHDGLKSGTQEEYERSKYTKHEHPWLMSQKILTYTNYLPYEDLTYISNAIASHMGQWNTNSRSNVVLLKPTTDYQKLLHLCDYLASRKDLIMEFEGSDADNVDVINEDVSTPVIGEVETPETHIITIGKYRGKTWVEVKNSDPSYFSWAFQNMDQPLEKNILAKMK